MYGHRNIKDAGEFTDSLSTDAVQVVYLPQKNSLGNTAVAIPILDLYTIKDIYLEQPWMNEQLKKGTEEASLRFTWELMPPQYYNNKEYAQVQLPLVFITGNPTRKLPPHFSEKFPQYQLRRQFSKTTKIFRYQTNITIFDKK